MNRLSTEYYGGLEARLRALTQHVESLATAEQAGWFREYLDVGEYGLAVKAISEVLEAGMAQEHLQPLAQGFSPRPSSWKSQTR